MDDIAQFDFPTDSPKIIKVIGVGGGGGNAVNHMYREGIHDVAFVVCNTDRKALEESPVPVKLQLGHEGLGAGNRPKKAKEATEESINEVQGMLNDGTKMVFITAGMGFRPPGSRGVRADGKPDNVRTVIRSAQRRRNNTCNSGPWR